MGLLLTTGEYVKIKDYSITANELQYYHFKNYAARTAMTEVEMAKIKPVTLKIPIIMSGTADSSKSIQDNLKTIAYEIKCAIRCQQKQESEGDAFL